MTNVETLDEGAAQAMRFYSGILSQAIATARISKSDSVLVVCGSKLDRDCFHAIGFTNVLISNLNDFMDRGIEPYRWERIDAEDIPHQDKSFDVVVVHMGLHHCQSPHRGMAEMMRVARKAVIAIEARDSFTINTAKRLGLTADYEIEAVTGSRDHGGLRGGPIPNFVYRWTEKEVHKTVASYEPRFRPELEFFHGLLLPTLRLRATGRHFKRLVLTFAAPFARMVVRLLPRQGNQFGWIIWQDRPEPHDWISSGVLDKAYVEQHQLVYRPPARAHHSAVGRRPSHRSPAYPQGRRHTGDPR